MIVGGYSLHLYCSAEGHRTNPDVPWNYSGEFAGPNERAAKKEARQMGWEFSSRDVVCRYCAAAERKRAREARGE